jgi:hypothetical protein
VQSLVVLGAIVDPVRTATVPLIFMFFFFYDFAYTPMIVSYTLEILPYNIRARGLAIMVGTFVTRPRTLSNILHRTFLRIFPILSTCSSIHGHSTPLVGNT